MRPVELKQATEQLRAWEGHHVRLLICDRAGTELARVWGIFLDHSTEDALEFGLDEPGNPTATIPVHWDGPFSCTVSDTCVMVATPDGAVLKIEPTATALPIPDGPARTRPAQAPCRQDDSSGSLAQQ